MELINNIWIALSTPNEFLITLLSIPFTILEIFVTLIIFSTILKINISNRNKLIYVVVTFITCFFASHFLPTPINLFIDYITLFLLMFFLFKLNILQTLIAVFVPLIIYALVGTLLINPFLSILHISYQDTETIPIYRIIYLSIMYFIIFMIILLLKYYKIKLEIFDDIDKKSKNILLINSILGFMALAIQLIITIYYTDILPVVITFLSFLFLLAYISISIYSLTRVIKLTQTTKRLENAEEYNKTLRILHDNVRGFKHDFDNIVTTIGGYIKTNDMNGLKQYYIELEDDCQRASNLYILNPEIINNPGIYNLLNTKYKEAESKNIKVNMSLLLDLNDLKMKIYEFARILGILLDNAIEASELCDDKIINIIFRDDDKKHRQLIIIENTYKNKDVNIVKIFGKGISEKENHTGLGLWEINKILRKNNNVSLFTSKNEKYFSQQLEVYY